MIAFYKFLKQEEFPLSHLSKKRFSKSLSPSLGMEQIDIWGDPVAVASCNNFSQIYDHNISQFINGGRCIEANCRKHSQTIIAWTGFRVRKIVSTLMLNIHSSTKTILCGTLPRPPTRHSTETIIRWFLTIGILANDP